MANNPKYNRYVECDNCHQTRPRDKVDIYQGWAFCIDGCEAKTAN